MKKDNSYRVFRGGSWAEDDEVVSSDSNWDSPECRDDALGFRLSRVVNPLEQLSEVLHEKR